MASYFNHWLQFGRELPNPPRIFCVNWFRKDENGKWLWPGFSENMRVLQWIVDRSHGHAIAVESPIGWMPRYDDFDWRGTDFSHDQFQQVMSVDVEKWKTEVLSHEALFVKLYDRLPKEMLAIRELLLSSLWRSPSFWEFL
jgi:phosphoenolpyruvate carboxykinase (GTP)